MAVSIDPSEVRCNGTSVKPGSGASRARRTLRALLIGGLGGAGLVAFSVGAFSFFSGLADPRARNPRPMAVATKMPDLKDGLPALASEDGAAQPTRLNLPRTAPAEPQAAQPLPAKPAAIEAPVRSAVLAASPDIGEVPLRTHERPEPDHAGSAAKAAPAIQPTIQNAAVIADAPRTAVLVAPAKAETVKAKVGQPSAFVSLPAETRPAPRHDPQPQHEAAVPQQPEARKAAAKPPLQKTAARKPDAAVPVAEATPAPQPAAPHASDDGDVMSAIPGGQQLRAGWKAIGGVFGGSDGD